MPYENQDAAERGLKEMSLDQDKLWCPHRRHTCWTACALRFEGRVFQSRSGLFDVDPPGCAEMCTRALVSRAVDLLEVQARGGSPLLETCGKCCGGADNQCQAERG
ncbi:MAG: hypothetical protein KKA60_14770 [Proteobacteria bacterium]|nr:hypothetical protein [Pseudomonadota bacterium]